MFLCPCVCVYASLRACEYVGTCAFMRVSVPKYFCLKIGAILAAVPSATGMLHVSASCVVYCVALYPELMELWYDVAESECFSVLY